MNLLELLKLKGCCDKGFLLFPAFNFLQCDEGASDWFADELQEDELLEVITECAKTWDAWL